MSRNIQNKSSGRVIIVDVCVPYESICEHLSQALTEFVLMNNSIPGTPRVQLLSVYLLGQTTECLVQLQYVKTNLQKIIQSINEMVVTEGFNKGGKEQFEDHLNSILLETLIQFQQLHRSSEKLVSSTPQLDICLITSQRQGMVERQAAKVLKDSDMNLIKKLQLVHIANTSFNNETNDLPSSDDSAASVDSGANDILCGYVESLFIENNVLSYEQYFKTWLQDIGSDEVHLFIEFNQEDDTGFVIKCDLHDVIVNPLNITGGQHLVLQTETDVSPLNITLSSKSKAVSKLSVYSLRPKTFVKLKNVCESVLYGFPRIVRPTSCWKLDWEELEKNQCYFAGIRTYLFEEELSLLLVDENQPITAHYLLLPSPDSTMLIKSISVRDLMMPLDSSVTISNKKEEITTDVLKQMQKITISETFNPFYYFCGLFNRMMSNSVKPNTAKPTAAKSNVKKRPVNQSASSKASLLYSKTRDFNVGAKSASLSSSKSYSSKLSSAIPDRTSTKSPLDISVNNSFSTNKYLPATKKTPESSEKIVFQKFSLMPSALQDEEESIEPVPIVPSYTLPSARELTACKYVPRFNVRSKQPSNVYADLPPMKPTFKQGASAPKKRK